MANLVLEAGRARANAQLGKADAWRGAIQSIPGNLAGWAEARDRRTQDAERQADRAQAAQVRAMQIRGLERDEQRSLAEWDEDQQIRALGPLVGNDPSALAREVGVINPAKAAPYQRQATQAQAELQSTIHRWTGSILHLPDEKRPEAWTRFRRATPKGSELPEPYDEGLVRDLFLQSATDEQFEAATKPAPTPALIQRDPTRDLTHPITGAVVSAGVPAPPDRPKPGTLEAYFAAVGADTPAKQLKAKREWEAAGRAPEKPEKVPATDDPELPRGVTDYIGSMRQKVVPLNEPGPDGTWQRPYTYEDAQRDLAATWSQLRRDNPRVDVVKADNALRALFRPAPGSGTESLIDVLLAQQGGGGTRPPVTAAPSPPRVPPVVPPASGAAPPSAPRQPIPGIPGAEAELQNGRWIRVK